MLYNVRFFNGERFVASAENIMAYSKRLAVSAALRAIRSRRDYMKKAQADREVLEQMAAGIRETNAYRPPAGWRVFVATVTLGEELKTI